MEYEDIISGTGQLNKDIFSKESSKAGIVFHKGDVLYGKLRPYLQNWLLPQFNGLAVGDFWVLQPQNIDSSFLYRLIQSRQFDEVANQSTGTKMPRADWKLVSKSDFFVPLSIEEQAAIGNYFEQLDHLIALHQRKQQLFFRFASLMTFIRTNAWEQRKLGEIALDTFGGGTPSTGNEAYWDGDIPWIQSSDLTEHQVYGVIPHKHISRAGLMNSATKLVPADSLAVITRVGVGKLAVMPFSYTTSQDFLSLSKLQTDKWFTAYALYQKLQGELNSVQGTSIKGITKEELLAKKIFIPNCQEQVAIGAFFHSLDDLIALHQRK
ncbi:MAG: restriction endonuclease subunit S [Oscillospiraceae bacterium]|nr:restriction endonuclease subunit S [Oscillospiraceae bacterium]